nr:hypothetical protein [Kibdelosporangium sp. MJ126-NF4]CEL21755.1 TETRATRICOPEPTIDE REPEAT FAMILY PROTEIN [Kibdelosporangium sp. MJ126-NF4]CTQ92535.1 TETRATRICOPEPTIDE REPEAT FAMILY PROTEIN [Kibdelosporangium sp. MJ126-NF4]
MDGRQRARELITQGKFEQLRQAADDGDSHAKWMHASLLLLSMDETALKARKEYARLADLLARQERLDELRELVHTHHPAGTIVLAKLLAKQGRLDELIRLQDAGRSEANRPVADILLEQGRIDELRAQAAAGNRSALAALVMVLKREKDIEGLQALAHDHFAEEKLIDVLAGARRYQEAVALQRVRAGRRRSVIEETRLTELLVRAGLEEELLERAKTDKGVRNHLVRLYARQGRVDDLRAMAETGLDEARQRLIEVLREQQDVDELRKLADEGHRSAVRALLDTYQEQGRVDEVRAMAQGNTGNSRSQLAEMLRERGEVDELRELAAADRQHPAFRELVAWLAEHEQVDELEELSRTGDSSAVAALARLAPERLWPRAEAGDTGVIWQLTRAYRKQENVDELRRLAALGDREAQLGFLSVLLQSGMLDELKARAEAGEPHAMSYWIEHLAEVGEVDELRALADDGHASAAIKLAEVLGEQGRFAEVVARAKAGDRFAARHLAYVIAPPFDDNPEDRIRP